VSSQSPDRWQRVEATLEAVLAARPEEHAELLSHLCAGDDELRRDVESLLAADVAPEGFLDTSADAFAAPYLARALVEPEATETEGRVVGRYRLVEEIGRGGMGTVYLAERADGQFEHRVALKLVKRGMDTDEILDRFLRERQILARLQHPGIARLLDGDVSDDGRPYFVMEFVDGLPITEHCDARQLPVEERLQLFAVACRAVQHAHRNLVVHRDIKPSNVMVTLEGEVKLLDFGIARLLGDEEGAITMVVRSVSGLMTPEYASPEQVVGDAVTTASDVYQLGALLYELLTGHRPYRLNQRTPSEIRRAVCEVEPTRPSTVVRRTEEIVHRDGSPERIDPAAVSGRRATTPERLRRRLKGDLDTIVLRALRKEPERRYPSAEALAEDVERHLANLPLRFGGDRLSYRAAKFARRHRLGVASAAGIVLLTGGLISYYTLQLRAERDRARLEATKATESAQLMGRFFQSWNPDAADRAEVSATTVLRDAALRAERELGNRPEMLAATLSILGDFQTSLGEWAAADSLLGRALTIQETLYDEPNADLASTIARQGRLYGYVGDLDRSESSLRQALALHRDLYGVRHAETLRIQRELALTLRAKPELKEAETLLRDILDSLEESDRATPFAVETASQLGYTIFLQARYDEAVAILRPTLERQRRMFGTAYGPSVGTIRHLASALRDRGDLEEAESLYREALRLSRSIFGPHHMETGYSVTTLSLVLERKGELEEAESLAREALAITERNLGPDHFAMSGGVAALGGIRLDRGDPAEAERWLRRGLAISRRSFPAGHPENGDFLNRLAFIAISRGSAEADAVYREAVAFDGARPAGSPIFVTDGIHFLAWSEHRNGDLADAETDYRRALGLYRRQLPDGHAHRASAATGLGSVLLDAGRTAEARRYLREGLAQWEAHRPAAPERVAEARELLGRAEPGAISR
jgi:serine/threonine protein kinase